MIRNAFAAAALIPLPLHAIAGVLTIGSPDMEKGEASIRAGTAYEYDGRKNYSDFRKQEIQLAYSPTDFWITAVDLAAERERNGDIHYASTELKNTFRVLKQGRDAPFSAGFRIGYEKAQRGGEPDEAYLRFMLRHKGKKLETRINIGGITEVGSGAQGGVAGDLRASFRYAWSDRLKPAIDYLGKTGKITDMPGFSQQNHLLGPVLYGKLTEGVSYEFGYLAGISQNATDHNIKLNVKYTF